MEKQNLTTLHGEGSSSTGGIPQSSSPLSSESTFFDYQFDGRDFITEREMMLKMSLQQHQDLMDRQNAVLLNYLKETAKQAQALRQENVNLKMVNAELTQHLSLLTKSSSENGTFGLSGLDSVVSGLSRMSLAGGNAWNDVAGDGDSPSPTSVMDSRRVEGNVERVVLPKSISVRSSGYLKSVQAGGSSGIGVGLNKVLGSSNISNEAVNFSCLFGYL